MTAIIHRFCPACIGSFRTTRGGVMVRHGFNAKNVKHGANMGFHTGACQGTGHEPLGTEAGNAFALRIAGQQEATAETMEALPPFTTEDAVRAAIREIIGGEVTTAMRRGRREEAQRLQKSIETATAADFAKTSYRGWFNPDSIEGRRSRMMKARADEIAARRDHAAGLRDAVQRHPPEDEAA